MNFRENLRIAIDGLLVNRMRAILTMLGIIIGVGAVIGLISLGRGVETFVASEFQSLGSNILFVTSSTPVSSTRTTIQPLSTREGEALASRTVAPSIGALAMQYDVLGIMIADGNQVTMAMSGVSPSLLSLRGWSVMGDGRFIDESDDERSSRVVVLGLTTVERLFGDRTVDPVGRVVRINDRVFTVIGVLNDLGSGGLLGDQNFVAYIPLSTAQSRLDNARTRDGGYAVDMFHIQAVSEEAASSVSREIEAYLTEAHGITFQGEQDFTIISQSDLLSSLGQVTGILTIFLSLIAAISLLVGGIGIMNIMLVSVTERTREIGLRKAVGARASDIMMQFLIESIVLSLIGGSLGIGLGGLIAFIGGILVPDLQLSVTSDAVLLATFVSSFIGIFFGLYPASRAAKMRPIDALRFE